MLKVILGGIVLIAGVAILYGAFALISWCCNLDGSNYSAPKTDPVQDNYMKINRDYIENMRKDNQRANWKNQYGY